MADDAVTYIDLGDEYVTPDGMTLDETDNCIVLAVPSCLADGPGSLLKITPDDEIVPWFEIPAHPVTGKGTPLGIAFGPDGHLYVADSQDIGGDSDHKGRLMRVVVEDGEPVRAEVLATGFCCPNGLAVNGGNVYFCETTIKPAPTAPMISGVFCFDIDELDPAAPYEAKPYVSEEDKDPHFLFQFITDNPDWTVGANGLGFSAEGEMYVCNFGEASLLGVTLSDDGKSVVSERVVAQGQGMGSTDGLKVSERSGMVIIADFAANAVWAVSPRSGRVFKILQNEVGTGANGELDRCSEVCLRDGKIYVANIDLPFENENDAPHSITVIDIRKLMAERSEAEGEHEDEDGDEEDHEDGDED
jgi:sugar lactone lactonase YvrE